MGKFKSGFVALIGRTNVGKSTLMNRLIGQKIAITSNKPQTTRTKIRTILTTEEGQAVFLDTPGIHKAKTKLGEYMVNTAERTVAEADLILWLIEPSDYIGTGDMHIAEVLGRKGADSKGKEGSEECNIAGIPKVLVINKTDTISKEKLAELINRYKDLCDFDEVVPISALKGYNEDVLKKVIFKLLPEGPMYYDEDELTDQPERQIVAELIREKALKLLDDEIPHGIAVAIEKMKERPSNNMGADPFYDIEASIVCERESHKGIIIGKQGAMIKKIGTAARLEAEALLGCRINLKLFVKVKKDWRDSAFLLKNYGFDIED
ncbi:MAG: GTPase Era [Lachnospiraceae bacterium]|nr:GTPase Era [Lachnospiraceae bacterium]